MEKLTIPLTQYSDGRNPFSETSLEIIAKLFVDNDPKWEEKIIQWMKIARHQGLLNTLNFEYKSIVLE